VTCGYSVTPPWRRFPVEGGRRRAREIANDSTAGYRRSLTPFGGFGGCLWAMARVSGLGSGSILFGGDDVGQPFECPGDRA
jgi:hypothetical protein